MATTRISEAEAVRDIAGLLVRVRAGEEIVVESGATPNVVMSRVSGQSVRLRAQPIPQDEAHSKRPGFDWESLKQDRDEGRP